MKLKNSPSKITWSYRHYWVKVRKMWHEWSVGDEAIFRGTRNCTLERNWNLRTPYVWRETGWLVKSRTNLLNSTTMHLSKYCPSNHHIVRAPRKHLHWTILICRRLFKTRLTVFVTLMSHKQHELYVLISPSPPPPIRNKKFSDQHWKYVQKYGHLEPRFIAVTYHIKAFSLFAINWFCSEYWGPINNATFTKSPPFSIQENPSSNFTNGHKP